MSKSLQNKGKNETLEHLMSFFSDGLSSAISAFFSMKKQDIGALEEVRIRARGVTWLSIGGRLFSIGYRAEPSELQTILKRVCGMALFAHRDDISSGFVTADGGIRVGVAGFARYDGGRLVGVSEISSLVFRIPVSECSIAHGVYRQWRGSGGLLVIAPPCGGKTTLIRSLARLAGSGVSAMRTVVVDERCEFDPLGYADSAVDILRGYRRAEGISIAIRTMAAELVAVDELGSAEDAAALRQAAGAGVTVLATAHGTSIGGVMSRGYIRELAELGVFSLFAVIFRTSSGFDCRIERAGGHIGRVGAAPGAELEIC